MLKLENMFENFDLVREALAFWAHDEENLEDMLGYFRISSNAVYPFTAGGKVCFLRLAPVDEKVEGDILGELEFIRYLRGQGYPACGWKRFMDVFMHRFLKGWTVCKWWIPGIPGRRCTRMEGRWGDCMHCLRRMYPRCGSGRMWISWNGYGKSWRSTEGLKGRGRSLKR